MRPMRSSARGHRGAGVAGRHHGRAPCRRAPPRRPARATSPSCGARSDAGSSSMAMTSEAGTTLEAAGRRRARPADRRARRACRARRRPPGHPRRSRPAPGRRPSRRRRSGRRSRHGFASARRRRPGGRGTSRSSAHDVGQLGRAAPRAGAAGRARRATRQLARRLRLFDFDFFFLGTAIARDPPLPVPLRRATLAVHATGRHTGAVVRRCGCARTSRVGSVELELVRGRPSGRPGRGSSPPSGWSSGRARRRPPGTAARAAARAAPRHGPRARGRGDPPASGIASRPRRPGLEDLPHVDVAASPRPAPRQRRHSARQRRATVPVTMTAVSLSASSVDRRPRPRTPSGTRDVADGEPVERRSVDDDRAPGAGCRSSSVTPTTNGVARVATATGPGRRTPGRRRLRRPARRRRFGRAGERVALAASCGRQRPSSSCARARSRSWRASGRRSPRPRGASDALRPRRRPRSGGRAARRPRTTSVRCTMRSAWARAASRMSSPRGGSWRGTPRAPSAASAAARSSSGRRLIASSSSSRISSRLIITTPTAASAAPRDDVGHAPQQRLGLRMLIAQRRTGRRRRARPVHRAAGGSRFGRARSRRRTSSWLRVTSPGGAAATGSGTIEDTSPPKRAISRMNFEARTELADADGRNTVSTPETLWFICAMLQLVLEVGHGPQALDDEVGTDVLRRRRRRASRTSTPRTLSRCASDSSIIASRSSSENSGSPFCGLRIAATTTSSKRYAAVSMISMWPLWRGSNDPGYSTFVTVAPFPQWSWGRAGDGAPTVLPYRRDLDYGPPRPGLDLTIGLDTTTGTGRSGEQSAQPSKAYGGSTSARSNARCLLGDEAHHVGAHDGAARRAPVGVQVRPDRLHRGPVAVDEGRPRRAPRDSASMPSAPLPANRSSTAAPSTRRASRAR